MKNEIPKLKKDKFNLYDVFIVNDIEEDDIDELTNKYSSAILDIFDEQLKQEDERLKLLDSDFFRLKNESKYIEFINKLFMDSQDKCYLCNIGVDLSNYDVLIDKIQRLDKIDSFLLLEIHKFFDNSYLNNYLIDDINLVNLFVKGMLREAISCTMYFPKYEVIISYGYDGSLPIICKQKKDLDFLKNEVKKHELFLR